MPPPLFRKSSPLRFLWRIICTISSRGTTIQNETWRIRSRSKNSSYLNNNNNRYYYSRRIVVYILLCGLFFYIPFTNDILEHIINTDKKTTTLQQVVFQTSSATIDSYLHPWPKRVYVCGWHQDLLSSLIFPNVTTQPYGHWVSILQNIPLVTSKDDNDNILIFGMHGPCGIHDTSMIWNSIGPAYVQAFFPGKVLFVNGESYGNALVATTSSSGRRYNHNNIYQLGAIGTDTRVPERQQHTLHDFYYMSLAFLELAPTRQQQDLIFDHIKKPQNTGKFHGIIYVASNCVDYRDEAADRLSDIDPQNFIVYYGGKCHGKRKQRTSSIDHDPNDNHAQILSKLIPAPVIMSRKEYKENSNIFQNYRYCLVMENTAMLGYMTEKIINAFLGGCIPIYYGTREIFDIFNKNAFIFYDVENPESALQQIRYMEMENRSAYDEMLTQQPILANKTATIERYFSLRDDIGGGKLIQKIRQMLGFDPNPPPSSSMTT